MDVSSPTHRVPSLDDDDFLKDLSNLTVEEAKSIADSLNGSFPDLACTLVESAKERVVPPPLGACKGSFDGLICWPATSAESTAVLSCLAEINGIEYNTTQNVSRLCHANGTWDYTDYSECKELDANMDISQVVEITTMIYFVGYISSLIALIVAVWIFAYFKDLRCLRNVIHTNLMCTYILTDFVWILTLALQMSAQTNMAICVFLMILLHYFHLTNFFWMFVEGLYLYMLVVETFTGENIKLRVYASIGWGCPVIFIVLWTIVKVFTPEDTSHLDYTDNPWKQCPWMRPYTYDWIYQAPAIGILFVNLVFLFVIMWVLITKLRSAQTVETQQYRKAAKALLVLIPLLGITYVLVIVGPTDGIYKNIYDIVRATLIATQGFTVALFYCFLNAEVQNTIRHHRERWKTARSFKGSRRYTYSGHSKDWSPRSRTESIRPSISLLTDTEPLTQRNSLILTDIHTNPRLFSQPSTYRKRESSASEVTTTTLVNVNGGSRVSGGARSPFLHPGVSGGPGGSQSV